ncbi:MAG: DUF3299 domain-containing protein [Candidatus Sumerlaeota bacterium]|nr:DUF3299 domain-containing protein [Candidatus Sumerlaeota bacterium]
MLFGGRNVHDVDLITSGALVGKPDPNGVNGATFAMLMKTLTNPMRYDPVLESLDGLRVSLSGYIMPYDTYIKMKQFQLIYAPPACPYCDPPLPSEFVLVRLKKGETRDYNDEPVKIVGRLLLRGKGHNDPGLREYYYVIDEATVEKYGGL